MKLYLFTMLTAILLTALFAPSAFADRPRSSLSERVVGGTPTTIDRYPFIVGMNRDFYENGNSWEQACGGTILTSRHILSAGHCYRNSFWTDWSQPRLWQVRAGSNFRSSGGVVAQVLSMLTHPQYNDNNFDNDVTILTLETALPLGANIAQASIPPQGYNHPDNAVSFVVGWGTTSSGGSYSENLLHGEVRTINHQICTERYASRGNVVTDSMLCAGLLDIGGVDACQADSGGPFVLNNIVIGVTSWGYGCASAFYPGVYARVSHFTNWIVSNAN